MNIIFGYIRHYTEKKGSSNLTQLPIKFGTYWQVRTYYNVQLNDIVEPSYDTIKT